MALRIKDSHTLSVIPNTFYDQRHFYSDDTYVYYFQETINNLIACRFNGTSFVEEAVQSRKTYACWGDGTYIYALQYDSTYKIFAYTFDGSTFTEQGSIAASYSNPTYLYHDGTYLYKGGPSLDLEIYTFDGSTFSLIKTVSGHNIDSISSDSNYVYTADSSVGLRSCTFDGATFTVVDTYSILDPYSSYTSTVVTGGGYVFYSYEFYGVFVFQMSGSSLSLVARWTSNVHLSAATIVDMFHDGTYLYTMFYNMGIGMFSFDGTNLVPVARSPMDYTDGLGINVVGDYIYTCVYVQSYSLPNIRVFEAEAPLATIGNLYAYGIIYTDWGNEIRSMLKDGNYIYCGSSVSQSFRIYGISDETIDTPLIGSSTAGNYSTNLQKSGDYVFAAEPGSGLRVYDVSNPASPTQEGFDSNINFYSIDDMILDGNYLYLVSSAGFHIYDVSTPGTPSNVFSDGSNTSYITCEKIGNYVYAVREDATEEIMRLEIWDVSTPVSASLTKTTTLPWYVYDMCYHNGTLFLAMNYEGIYSYDVSDPENPSLIRSLSVDGRRAVKISCEGDYAYLALKRSAYAVVDISNPNYMTLEAVGTEVEKSNNTGTGVVATTDYVYSGLSSLGFQKHAKDLKSYTSTDKYVALSSMSDTAYEITALTVDDRYLYSGVSTKGYIIIYDLNTLSTPVLIHRTAANFLGTQIDALDVNGDYLYVANNTDGLAVVDISTKTSPSVSGTVDDGGKAVDLVYSGGYVYLANDTDGIRVYDVSNPASPTSVSNKSVESGATSYDRIGINGDRAFVVADVGSVNNSIYIYDISTPTNISYVEKVDSVVRYFLDLEVDDNYLYTADFTSLLIYDKTDYTTPVSSIPLLITTDVVGGMKKVGDKLYISALLYGLVVVNVSDPTDPYVEYFSDQYNSFHSDHHSDHHSDQRRVLEVTDNPHPIVPMESGGIVIFEEAPAGGLTADFTSDVVSGDIPLTVQFTDQSSGGTPTTWYWDFGDGNTSTEQNPTHIYTGGGLFTVSLTVTGSPTSTETKTDYMSVSEIDSSSFSILSRNDTPGQYIVIYVDAAIGSNSNYGTVESPYLTLEKAITDIKAGGIIVLQDGTYTAGTHSIIQKNMSIIAAHGANPVINDVLSFEEAQILIQGLHFTNIATNAIIVDNSSSGVGTVSVKDCNFDNIDYPIQTNSVAYVSVHMCRFHTYIEAVNVSLCRELTVSSNIYYNGYRAIYVSDVEWVDVYHNTIYGANDAGTITDEDQDLRVIYVKMNAARLSSGSVSLPTFAASNDYGYDVAVNPVYGPTQEYGIDYTVINGGITVYWKGMGLEGPLTSEDVLRIVYSEAASPTSGDAISVYNMSNSNSRIDSNNINDASLGVYMSDSLKLRYNNLNGTTTHYSGTPEEYVGNITGPPGYVDASNGDFHLNADSVNIDAADPDRWATILREMGIGVVNGQYTGISLPTGRAGIAPFNRDLDRDYLHRLIRDGWTGTDIGAYEYPTTGSNPETYSYIEEQGYDHINLGSMTGPFATIERGFSGAKDIQVETNDVRSLVINFDGTHAGLTGGGGEGATGYSYSRFRSKDLDLSDLSLGVGNRNKESLSFLYPSYPKTNYTGIFISPPVDAGGLTGGKYNPLRTVQQALSGDTGAGTIFVSPGLYPSFDGESGKRLVGLHKMNYVDYNKVAYNNFKSTGWTGPVGDYSGDQLLFTSSGTVYSRFSLSGDIYYRVDLDAVNDTVEVGIENPTNSISVELSGTTLSFKHTTGGFSYTVPATVSDTHFRVTIKVSGATATVRAKSTNTDITRNITLVSGYSVAWNGFATYSDSGSPGSTGVLTNFDTSADMVSAVGITGSAMARKVFGVLGESNLNNLSDWYG